MRTVHAIRPSFWVVACVALLLSSCGGDKSKGVKLEGKLVKDGQPIKVGTGDLISLSFIGSEDGKPTTFGGQINPDGTFVVNKIPPGKYKLKVTMTAGGNTSADLKKAETLSKQFEAANAKMEYEVTSDSSQKIEVDAGKGTVSKQP